MSDRLYVIAGNYRQYADWCRDNRIGPGDATYIHRPEQLRGCILDEHQVRWVGTPESNPHMADIQDELRTRIIGPRGGKK